MATRTFDNSSIINFVDNLINQPTNTVDWVKTVTGFNLIQLTVTDAQTNPSFIQILNQVFGNIQGDIDFTQFPQIPVGALVTGLRIRYQLSYASDAHADTAGTFINCDAGVFASFNSSVGQVYPITPQSVNDGQTAVNPANAAGALVVSPAASEIVYDFSGSPIPIATFIAQATFQSIDFQVATGGIVDNLLTTGCNCDVDGTFIFSNWEFIVEYTTGGFQWTIDDQATPKKAGELVTIRSVDGGLDTVIGVDVGDECTVPIIDFYFQSPNVLQFYLPFCLHDQTGSIVIALIGDGRLWSDPIPVGPITIFFEDGSGIYTIVLGKTSDTIYDPVRDGTTDEVKIPDPYVRTGFIDG